MAEGDVQNIIVSPASAPAESDSITTTTQSGGTLPTPAATQAIAAENAAERNVATAMGAQSEAEALAATQRADQLAADADLRRQQAADAAAEHQYNLDRISHARTSAAQAEDEYANHKFEDYWDNKSFGKKLLTGIGLFLGAGGAAAPNSGGRNLAAEALDRQIDRHFQGQQAERAKLRDVAKMRGDSVNDLYHQIDAENGSLAIKEAKAREAIAAQALEQLTRSGIPVEQAKGHVFVQQQLAKAAGLRREAEQHYSKTYGNTTTKKHVLNSGTTAAGSLAQQRLGLQERRLLDKEVGDWAKQNGLPEIARQHREFSKISEKLTPTKDEATGRIIQPDPETQVMALMELDKAAKGGTATGASMAAALAHMGGSGDKFAGLVERAKSGGLAPGQLNILRTAVKRGTDVNVNEATGARESFRAAFKASPQRAGQRADLDDLEEGLFRGFGYTNRKGAPPPVGVAAPAPAGPAPAPAAAPASAPPKATPPIGSLTLPDGRTVRGYLTSDNKLHLVP